MQKEELDCFLNSLGLISYGLIECRPFTELKEFLIERKESGQMNEFEEEEIEKRIHPEAYLDGAKTILSIAFPYYDGGKGKDNGFSVYTKRADYHKVVHSYLEKICDFLRSRGEKAAAFTDSNALPERYIAALAKVGAIGKNQMLITKEYGSYVFLGEVITTAVLPVDAISIEQVYGYEICRDCELCRMACPGHALQKEGTDTKKCVSYLTQKKELTDEELLQLNGQIFGCDVCQMVCPLNHGKKSGLIEFSRMQEMERDASFYAACDKKFFNEVLKNTSCGWRGKNVISRNAMARMAKKGEEIAHFKFASPYLEQYKQRIIGLKER